MNRDLKILRSAAQKYRFADVGKMLVSYRKNKEKIKTEKRARERYVAMLPFEPQLLGAFLAGVDDNHANKGFLLWGNIHALQAEIIAIEKKLKKARRGGRKQFKDAISFLELQKTNTFLKIQELNLTN